MASRINDFIFTVNTGTQYIFRGYIYDGILTKINILNMDYLPISEEEQNSYTLTSEESKAIYDGLIND